jgi:hypothetical protein
LFEFKKQQLAALAYFLTSNVTQFEPIAIGTPLLANGTM